MASNFKNSNAAFFLILNLLFFTLASSATASSQGTCPIDAVKLGVCADVLGSLLDVTLGKPPKSPCCSLLGDLADLEAAVCLCTAIELDLLGVNLDIPVALSLLLNYCGKGVPAGFQCP